MATPPRPEAIRTAQDLTVALKGMETRLGEAIEQGLADAAARDEENARHNRRNSKWIAFDIVVTILLAVFGYLSVHATQSAERASSAQLALCQAGNVSRGQQYGLWLYLIDLSPPKTAESKQLIAKFEQHLQVVFAPRNCAALGKGKH